MDHPRLEGRSNYNLGNPLQNRTNNMPMKWFKFIIWFQLFASAILNVLNGIVILNGSQYSGEAGTIYAQLADLQRLDMAYGYSLLGLAGCGIYVRFRLSGFCKNGPMLHYALLAVSIVLPLLYALAAKSLIDSAGYGSQLAPDFTSIIPNVSTGTVMLTCNVFYFRKRNHLFVNE